MVFVKRIILVVGAVGLLFVLCLRLQAARNNPASADGAGRAAQPARADLAEAVFAMVLDNAARSGLTLSQPVTLCEACVAAHVGLGQPVVRQQCRRACSLP